MNKQDFKLYNISNLNEIINQAETAEAKTEPETEDKSEETE